MEEKKITLREVLEVMRDCEDVKLREENDDFIVDIPSWSAKKYLSEETLEREVKGIEGDDMGVIRVKLKTGEQNDD